MPSQVLIRMHCSGIYQWWSPGFDPAGENPVAEGTLLELRAALGAGRHQLCLLAPGDRVSTRLVPYISRERRHIAQALPYQLEDLLVGDIEDVHFAFGKGRESPQPQGEEDAVMPVAWCDRQWLGEILLSFAEHDLELCHVVPEPLCLPRGQGWAFHQDDSLLCHIGNGHGFAVQPELAADVFAMLYQEHGAPDELLISAPGREGLDLLKRALPVKLQGLASEKLKTRWQVIAPQNANNGETVPGFELDLLQGEFGRRLPLAHWWKQWRGVAALLCVALLAWAANELMFIQQHHGEQARLQAQIEYTFRSVVPRGVLVDAEKQLRNRLVSLGGDTDYQGPVELLARIAPLVEQGDGILVRGLTYNMRQRELRLNCRAASFSGIEQLRGRFITAGLDAELVHSGADGDGQQARFRISWGQL